MAVGTSCFFACASSTKRDWAARTPTRTPAVPTPTEVYLMNPRRVSFAICFLLLIDLPYFSQEEIDLSHHHSQFLLPHLSTQRVSLLTRNYTLKLFPRHSFSITTRLPAHNTVLLLAGDYKQGNFIKYA